jgi:hypothetical protein
MKNNREWETKSLEWIHKVRTEMDEDIRKKGMTPAQWMANGKKGVPQGGVISPLLSNLYLNSVDEMMERAREVRGARAMRTWTLCAAPMTWSS